MSTTALTPELDALVNVAKTLSPELVKQVADFAEFLGKKHAAPAVDESDAWSDEDLRDFTRASAQLAEKNAPTS